MRALLFRAERAFFHRPATRKILLPKPFNETCFFLPPYAFKIHKAGDVVAVQTVSTQER
jgi:hypothetical protein